MLKMQMNVVFEHYVLEGVGFNVDLVLLQRERQL